MSEEKENKNEYTPPLLKVEYIEMEQGITANSSTIIPPTVTEGVTVEEWNNVKGNDDTFIEI